MDPSLASWYVHATASFHLLVFTKGNSKSVLVVKIILANE
jgi:hypothetical protein